MKKIKNKKIFYASIFIMLLFFIVAASLVYRTFQNDTFYTIKIGKLILENGIDMKDHFSIHILKYTYPHWLYDVFIYLIYSIGGYSGIYISSIVLFLILISIIYIGGYKLDRSLIASFVGVFIAMVMLRKNITARAQTISFILFALEIVFIEFFLKTGKKKYGLYLLLISLLICNMHVAVWPFYYILFLPYIAEYILSKILRRIKNEGKLIKFLKTKFLIDHDINIKGLFIIMGLSIFTGLLTPIKDTPYTYIIKTMMGNSQKYISEHAPVTLKTSILVLVIFIQTIFWTFFSKIKFRDFCLIMGTLLMGVISTRHISLLAVVASISLARTIAIFFNSISDKSDEITIDFCKKHFYIPIILLIVSVTYSVYTFKNEMTNKYIDDTFYPVEMVKYIKENVDIDKMRLFNDYNSGSYILLNDIPVFIDSRADLYTKEFSGYDYDIFDDYMNVTKNYKDVMEFYNITHLLLYKDYDLDTILYHDSDYTLLKEDDTFRFYEKKRK